MQLGRTAVRRHGIPGSDVCGKACLKFFQRWTEAELARAQHARHALDLALTNVWLRERDSHAASTGATLSPPRHVPAIDEPGRFVRFVRNSGNISCTY